MEKLENVKGFLLEHKYWVIGGLVALIIMGMGIYIFYSYFQPDQNEVALEAIKSQKMGLLEIEEEKKQKIDCQIAVDIKGEIVKPGLYELECDSRIQDVINLAGGITDSADTSVLNLSKKIVDEMVVVIYSKEQVNHFVTTKKEESAKQVACQNQNGIRNDACIKSENILDESINGMGDTPVNATVSLNTASKEELMTLSGIGASKAESIILYRQENGKFQTIEELKNVKGIGDSIFEKIKNNITI